MSKAAVSPADKAYRRRVNDLIAYLARHGMRGKGCALTGSDAATLVRRFRELERECAAQKLLAETMAINPTMNSRAARARVAKEA